MKNVFQSSNLWPRLSTALALLTIGILLGWGIAMYSPIPSHAVPSSDPTPISSNQLLSTALLASPDSAIIQNNTLIKIAKRVRPSVVNISTLSTDEQSSLSFPFFDDPFFRRFFGEEFERRFQQPEIPRRQQGTGSGVIVSADGYIITNNHVVEQASELQVLLSDKRKFTGKVVGTDPKTDLAVIKIDADNLPAATWGDSAQLEVGEIVLAIGNPFGLNQTVTMGIVSAVGRANVGIVDYEDFIQTDAAINPGNSGGALVNLQGELIGINTAIFSRSGGYMGIGFAIPSNMAKSVTTSLREHGKVVRGWLGVSIQELTPELAEQFQVPDTHGVLVSDVMENGPSEEAGVKRGDIIREYDHHPVQDPRQLRALVAETAPNTRVTIKILRDGRDQNITLKIGELPKDLASAGSGGSTEGDHALAGVTVEPMPSGVPGILVTNVAPRSQAERAGLRKNDILLEINRKAIRNIDDFTRITQTLSQHKSVLVLLKRGSTTIFLSIQPQKA
jgi:serine protease Do